MRRRPSLFTSIAVVFLLQGAACAAALADGGPAGSRPGRQGSDGKIGIRLLEASSNRRDDPRALLYVVDHINPGTTISRRLEISNTSAKAQRVTMFPGAATIDHNKFVPAPHRDANELSSWISIDPSEPVVPPNGNVQVTATIAIPENASRGERYGAIWAKLASSREPGHRNAIAMINTVGIRVYLDIGPGGDSPSDFRIDRLTPGRAKGGTPVVKAMVTNTGQRAIDLVGRMWLSDGPRGMRVGPFTAQVGTTLMPGTGAPIVVTLDDWLPDGPWRVKLLMESGRVRRTVTGTLTFPQKDATWGRAARLDSLSPWMYVAAGVLATVAALALAGLVVGRRLSERYRSGAAPRR
ncbi:DUF916 domain-containing protein [Sphaerisporangium corydalis]|uniref:DUF916 domain-containing protein n=1 Tax=Sphaerisporangium corydalis TaxID=1441875 RepID=A0ABV9EMB4_9ACTN|nr:DUF916 domain-containing protein [Sphaerisporangium corydalis]